MRRVHRYRKQQHFTILDNGFLRDERLSFRARGLLAYLLSFDDDWDTDSVRIAEHCPEGRDAIRAALNELEACGYLRRTRFQGVNGLWTTLWEIFEEPLETPESLAPGNQASVEAALKRSNKKKN